MKTMNLIIYSFGDNDDKDISQCTCNEDNEFDNTVLVIMMTKTSHSVTSNEDNEFDNTVLVIIITTTRTVTLPGRTECTSMALTLHVVHGADVLLDQNHVGK